MRRRSGASGQPVKTRRRKAATLKRRNGPKTLRRRSSSAADQETKVALLTRELNQAVEQQAATLIKTGMHLCEADVGAIWRPENGVLKLAATSGLSNKFVEFAKQNPIMPGRGTVSGRVVCTHPRACRACIRVCSRYERAVMPIRKTFRCSGRAPISVYPFASCRRDPPSYRRHPSVRRARRRRLQRLGTRL